VRAILVKRFAISLTETQEFEDELDLFAFRLCSVELDGLNLPEFDPIRGLTVGVHVHPRIDLCFDVSIEIITERNAENRDVEVEVLDSQFSRKSDDWGHGTDELLSQLHDWWEVVERSADAVDLLCLPAVFRSVCSVDGRLSTHQIDMEKS
jgi:hypothetical protein